MPLLSFLKTCDLFSDHEQLLPTSNVTVPNFLFGNKPRGPKILASLPTIPIKSGVATA